MYYGYLLPIAASSKQVSIKYYDQMKRVFTSCILFYFTATSLYAQELNGVVIDSQDEPIPGAYITHIRSEHHTHTNEFGKFSFHHVQEGDSLEIRHVGYDIRRIVIRSLKDPIMIKMQESLFQLDEIVVEKTAKSLSLLRRIDLVTNPVNSSQEILRKIPGLFIAQHSGGGKAEQIFLRGFDIDHGTDVSITADGIPVNMVSHAHGQGYSDLHFLIPETIEAIDFDKGPYNTDKGNFATAGYVDFKTKDKLDKSSVGLRVGQFNTFRMTGLFDIELKDQADAYLATEYLRSDGFFDEPQNFSRFNIMGKYTNRFAGQSKLSVLVSHFTSKWGASGLIPERAVASGMITRFGSIDDTQGGETSRSNLVVSYDSYVNEHTFFRNKIYYSTYDFDLFSNFTFYLEDPINGDQIRQKEDRQIFGVSSELNRTYNVSSGELLLQAGVGFRNDIVDDLELSKTKNRTETLAITQLGDVTETNIYTYINAELDLGKWLISGGARLDFFDFQYVNQLDSVYNLQSENEVRISPKLSFIYHKNRNLQFFVKSGIGFHSNDTRVVINNQGQDILPAAYGADLGFIWKATPRLVTNAALWYLFLDQEFVYVGDAGIVEPSGRSRRTGLDLGLRYQINDWLFADIDANYALARSVDEPEGARYIPLAPELTAMGGLSLRKGNFSAGFQARYLRDRPANEDNTIVAEGYFIADLNLGYRLDKIDFGIAIENIFNQEWNEAQFATESRLQFEPAPVEEIHFIPGTPFFFNASVEYSF